MEDNPFTIKVDEVNVFAGYEVKTWITAGFHDSKKKFPWS